jgi:membrane-associated PAP2 superfamily phosphatase
MIQPLSHYQWIIPLILFAALAYFTPELDLAISHYFYDSKAGIFPGGEIYSAIRFWTVIPAMFTAVAASLFLGLSYFISRWKIWRPYALLLILPMALGAGIITHSILKDHWGRPRPVQTVHFGGENTFRPFFKPNITYEVQPFKSFPCGHCSMGFYFFAVALLGRRLGSKMLFATGMALALTLGIALSVTRIAQGGHFFSDTLATALIMWTTALVCDWLLFKDAYSDNYVRAH